MDGINKIILEVVDIAIKECANVFAKVISDERNFEKKLKL